MTDIKGHITYLEGEYIIKSELDMTGVHRLAHLATSLTDPVKKPAIVIIKVDETVKPGIGHTGLDPIDDEEFQKMK